MPSAHQTAQTARVGIIRQALRARGWSLNTWAQAHGYRPRTVYSAVETWAGRTDRQPWGGISRAIMAALAADLGADIVGTPIPADTTTRPHTADAA